MIQRVSPPSPCHNLLAFSASASAPTSFSTPPRRLLFSRSLIDWHGWGQTPIPLCFRHPSPPRILSPLPPVTPCPSLLAPLCICCMFTLLHFSFNALAMTLAVIEKFVLPSIGGKGKGVWKKGMGLGLGNRDYQLRWLLWHTLEEYPWLRLCGAIQSSPSGGSTTSTHTYWFAGCSAPLYILFFTHICMHVYMYIYLGEEAESCRIGGLSLLWARNHLVHKAQDAKCRRFRVTREPEPEPFDFREGLKAEEIRL